LGLGMEAAAMRGLALAVVFVAAVSGFQVWGQEESGNRAYRRGDYPKAAERYRSAVAKSGGSPRLLYNLGTALTRLGDSEEARERLLASLEAQSPELRARAFFNLGNVLAQGPESGRESAENLKAAIDAYRRSLLLDARREDARWNLELAMQRLEKLQERQALQRGDEEGQRPPQGEESGDRRQPREGADRRGAPTSGDRRIPDAAQVGDSDAPLPRELAEQILRAVEESERGLQREKMRRQRRRVRGPDW
jgi:tetratricopeptide (TPR) repeat protein